MKRFLSFITLILTVVLVTQAQSSADILAYVDKYKQIALDQERQYGIPAPITLAQGILESGAGKSGLTRNSNNHFGVKALGGYRFSTGWAKNQKIFFFQYVDGMTHGDTA